MTGPDFYAYETGVLRSMLRTALVELQRADPKSPALTVLRSQWYAHEQRVATRNAARERA